MIFPKLRILAFPLVPLLLFSLDSLNGLKTFARDITIGIEIEDSDYPAVVKLNTEFPGGAKSSCTGTFVAPHFILTAAHCVVAYPTVKIGNRQQAISTFIHPKFKVLDPLTRDAPTKERCKEMKEDWIELTAGPTCARFHRDLALLEVDYPNPDILEIDFTPPVIGEEIAIVGFGADEVTYSDEPGSAHGVGVKRLGRNTIGNLTGFFFESLGLVRDSSFLDLFTEGAWPVKAGTLSSIAKGDSGGPAIRSCSANPKEDRVIGVTSNHIYGKKDDFTKSRYLRLDVLEAQNWIISTMKQESPFRK